jgi:hypothetical protein
MPRIGAQVFQRLPIPDLKWVCASSSHEWLFVLTSLAAVHRDKVKVWHCEPTGEVFEDYE